MIRYANNLLNGVALFYRGILKSGGIAGAVLPFAMVGMVVLSIVAREWFNYGATFAVQFTIWCSAFICFIGASYTQSLRRNITITILTGRLSKRAQQWLLAITTAVSWVICMVFLYYSSLMLQDDIVTGVRSPTPFRPPMAALHWVHTVGFALLALVLLTQSIQTFREIFSRNPVNIETADNTKEDL